MSEIQRHQASSRMSQAVVHNGTIYLAGQVSNADVADVKSQTTAILTQIDALLAKCGSDKSRILSATIYLADIGTFDLMNEAWEAWGASGELPARTTVEAKLAAPQYLVEITVIAAQ
ncbi:MAG: RidA family protein [Rhodospirillaceae bacterium]